MKRNKLQAREVEETAVARSLAHMPVAREFASPEEMLRVDAAQTEVPAAVAERLQESMGALPSAAPPPAPAPWWRRWLGR